MRGVAFLINSSTGYLGYYDRTETSGEPKRTVTPSSMNVNATHIRMTFKTSEIANCYIYDTIDNVYLWKGSDVTTTY